jgi:hypothetical protein
MFPPANAWMSGAGKPGMLTIAIHPTYLSELDVFVCPSRDKVPVPTAATPALGECYPYLGLEIASVADILALFGGQAPKVLSTRSPADAMVLSDDSSNHAEGVRLVGGNMLSADGHVAWVKYGQFPFDAGTLALFNP